MNQGATSRRPFSVADIESRRIGSSSLRLPRLALGCGNFGGVGSVPELFGRGLGLDQALELMDRAWELGITTFDTADAYGGGRSEAAIGKWLRAKGLQPTLTTKTSYPMAAGEDQGLAPARVRSQSSDHGRAADIGHAGQPCVRLAGHHAV